MDNLAWPFNLLFFKAFIASPYQIVRQMAYILR